MRTIILPHAYPWTGSVVIPRGVSTSLSKRSFLLLPSTRDISILLFSFSVQYMYLFTHSIEIPSQSPTSFITPSILPDCRSIRLILLFCLSLQYSNLSSTSTATAMARPDCDTVVLDLTCAEDSSIDFMVLPALKYKHGGSQAEQRS